MKSINKMAVVAALALSSAGMASAATVVYHVTGSTAFRVADVSAEVAILGGGTNVKGTFWGNTSLTGSNISLVENNAGTIVFENNFTGSVGGDQSIEGPFTVSFPDVTNLIAAETPSAITAGTNTTAASGGTNESGLTAPTHPTNANPDVAFSDVDPATTAATIIATANPPFNTSAASVSSDTVGIIPFVFVANGTATDVYGKLSGLSVTPQNFTFLYSNGTAPLSLFTGNASDTATVYALGRDIDSGTRSTALAETGYNLTGSGSSVVTTPVTQYFPIDASSNVVGNVSTAGVINNLELVPTQSLDGITLSGGNGGYNSGGNLSKAVSYQFTSGKTGVGLIAYLGVSDANSALTAGTVSPRNNAVLLNYNGYTFDPRTTGNSPTNSAKIYEGQYTFWGYEYIVWTATGAPIAESGTEGSGNPTFHYVLKTLSYDQLSSNGVLFANMAVSRLDDGLNVQPN